MFKPIKVWVKYVWGCLKDIWLFYQINYKIGTFVCQQWTEYIYKISGITCMALFFRRRMKVKMKWLLRHVVICAQCRTGLGLFLNKQVTNNCRIMCIFCIQVLAGIQNRAGSLHGLFKRSLVSTNTWQILNLICLKFQQ